jgi:5-methylcytosine-specific restriction endonuclease McrA
VPFFIKRGHGRFCSPACLHKWFESKQRGERNSNWRGGYDYEYGTSWYVSRKETKERDGYRCQVCGFHGYDISRSLDVHHIVPFHHFTTASQANQLSNLVTLCKECHPKVERGTITIPPAG